MTPPTGLFGRAWQININTQGDGRLYVIRSLVSSSEQPLRVVFSVNTYMTQAFWTADITIYNLRPAMQQNAGSITGTGQVGDAALLSGDLRILSGDGVTLSAGYELMEAGGQIGAFDAKNCLLYAGMVFQPIWSRHNVVDYTLKLRCIFGMMEDSLNLLNFNLPADATYYDSLTSICDQAKFELDIDSGATEKLKQAPLSRGQSFFGRPYDLIQDIMRQSTLFSWLEPVPPPASDGSGPVEPVKPKYHVRSFEETPTTPEITYGPPGLSGSYTAGLDTTVGLVKPTLIGVPEQTQDGVRFRVLLDSDVRNGMVIQLAPGTVINTFEFTPLQEFPSVPAHNGLYIVTGLHHSGDSRGHGEDWYTEITAVLWNFFPSFIAASSPLGANG